MDTAAHIGFRWTQTYSVGIAALDHQHRGLFDTINQLNEALEAGEGATVMDRVLRTLVDYTVTHFAAEESLMEKHRFPGLADHRAEHEAFKNKIGQHLENFRAGKVGAPSALLLFLQSWLRDHILKSDKAYSTFLHERGVH